VDAIESLLDSLLQHLPLPLLLLHHLIDNGDDTLRQVLDTVM
jgi:hypothetical protein